jgi:hypothetical protein
MGPGDADAGDDVAGGDQGENNCPDLLVAWTRCVGRIARANHMLLAHAAPACLAPDQVCRAFGRMS